MALKFPACPKDQVNGTHWLVCLVMFKLINNIVISNGDENYSLIIIDVWIRMKYFV